MKKKVLYPLAIIVLFLFAAQPCWAITIEHLSGNIYAETKTNYSGALDDGETEYIESATGLDAASGVDFDFYDSYEGVGAKAYAYGQKVTGDDGPSSVRFILTNTSQSFSGETGEAFVTSASVQSINDSDPGVNDMIKLQLTPDVGEQDMYVKLTAKAFLEGSLKSLGDNPSGTAGIDFGFRIFRNPDEDPIISFNYQDAVTKAEDNSRYFYMESLPGELGEKSTFEFEMGQAFYVQFFQNTFASVTGSLDSGAEAFGVQSQNDVISIAIEATPVVPTPEPSSILFLGALIIGGVLLQRRKFFQ